MSRKRINPGKSLPRPLLPSEIVRLLGRVVLGESVPNGFVTPCWMWKGGADKEGYGFIKVAGEKRWVHRVSHEVFKGPVPPGEEVNHGCYCRNCINPEHLNAEPASVNRSKTRRNKRIASMVGATEGEI